MPPRYASCPFSMACLVQYLSRCHDAESPRHSNWRRRCCCPPPSAAALSCWPRLRCGALHGKPTLPEPRRKRAKAYQVVR
jgi:hypothetical protein